MSAHDLFVDSFPHGTVKGFDLGCRTNHCPAPIACHVFRTRYVGDFGFRKRVDAGWTVEAIAEAEAAEARAAVEAERAARRAAFERKRKPKSLRPKPRADGKRKSPEGAFVWSTEQLATLRERHAAGDVDREIAEATGIDVAKVMYKRRELRLKGNRPKVKPHGTYARYDSGCQGDDCPGEVTCKEAAQEYWRFQQAAYRAGMTVTEYRKKVAA